MKYLIIYIFIFVFAITSVYSTCDNYTINLMVYTPPFCDINDSCVIYADTTNDSYETNMNVTVLLDNVSYYMDYVDNQWKLTLENNNTQDYPIIYQAQKVEDNETLCSNNQSATLKFRDAFEVTVQLYKNGIINNSNPKPYYSDFDYVYLVYTGTNPDSMIQQGRNSMRDVNNFIYTINKMIPQSKVFKSNRQFIGKSTLNTAPYYLWSKYNNGKATIKVYETGYYDIYTLNTKVQNNLIPYTEFQKPSRDDTVEIDNKITNYNLNESQILRIEANGIEYEGVTFWQNLIWSLIIIIVFLIIHALLYWVGDKVGLDGSLSVTLSFISVPIVLISLFIIWIGTIMRLIF